MLGPSLFALKNLNKSLKKHDLYSQNPNCHAVWQARPKVLLEIAGTKSTSKWVFLGGMQPHPLCVIGLREDTLKIVF